MRLEALVRELDQHPLWRQLLGCLATGAANQETMRIALDDKMSKGTVSVALEELRLRELIEYLPSLDRRQRIHDLIARGREVVAAAKIQHREVSPPPQVRPDRPQVADLVPARAVVAVGSGPPSGTPRRARAPSGEQTSVVRPATTVE